MAKKKIKNSKKPTKIRSKAIQKLKTTPIIINDVERAIAETKRLQAENDSLRQSNDSLKQIIDVEIKIK